MRICPKHWKAIREALKRRGIDHLGAKDGHQAIAAMVTEVEGRGAENEYDPLMACNWMIWHRGTEYFGLLAMQPDEHGQPRCPVCTGLELHEKFWILGPANAARDECERLKLIDGKFDAKQEEPLYAARPKVVCISGSTRFVDRMAVAAWEFEKGGEIAMGCHLLPHWYGAEEHHQAEKEGVADAMDALHLRKIDLADRLFVVNVGGYIGESTRREIEYAKSLGKPVSYLEAVEEVDNAR